MERRIRADKQKYMKKLAVTARNVAREGHISQPYDTTRKLARKHSKTELSFKNQESRLITEIR